MIIKTNDIESTELKDIIEEIQLCYFGLTFDEIEAAASHIYHTDTDWDSEDINND